MMQSNTTTTIASKHDPVTDIGYYGVIESTDFINGDDLAERLNFEHGVKQNSDAGWLKFHIGVNASCNDTEEHKIIYVAKKSLRHSVSWYNINDVDLVAGNQSINIGENYYRVRLLTGGTTSPGIGSEWNVLMYQIHVDNHQNSNNWDTYSDVELNIRHGDGMTIWCQENLNGDIVVRGFYNLTKWGTSNLHYSTRIFGWRPVLEQVSETAQIYLT